MGASQQVAYEVAVKEKRDLYNGITNSEDSSDDFQVPAKYRPATRYLLIAQRSKLDEVKA